MDKTRSQKNLESFIGFLISFRASIAELSEITSPSINVSSCFDLLKAERKFEETASTSLRSREGKAYYKLKAQFYAKENSA